MKSGKLLEKAGESMEYAEQYVNQYKDLIVLELIERLSIGGSVFITRALMVLLVLMSLLLIAFGLGLHLTEVWNSPLLAFLTVGGCLLLLTGVIYIFRRPLITNSLITVIVNAMIDEQD